MQKLHWIIQNKCFGEETDDFIGYIPPKQVTLIDSIDQLNSIDLSEYRVIRGSTGFIEDYNRKFGYYDYSYGPHFYEENYQCSKYYQKVNGLLNEYCIFMPWGMLKQKHIQELIFSTFNTDKFFIRPNSGRKIFTGTTLTQKWFSKELEIIETLPSTYGLNNDTMCLVAPHVDIEAEFRILMHKNEVIDFSTYSGHDKIKYKCISEGLKLAQSNNYYPDELYTIDIAQISLDMVRIVEYNSFVSAGLYRMHPAKIIKAVEKCYEREI